MTTRIGLVGCVSKKADRPLPARDLYESTLFLGRRRYVERTCDEWWILSAKHGLLDPLEVVAPYDVTLKTMGRDAKRRWSRDVLRQIDGRIGVRRGDIAEIHAGAEYRDFGLIEGLRRRGCTVEIPTRGLRIGSQLRFYKESTE